MDIRGTFDKFKNIVELAMEGKSDEEIAEKIGVKLDQVQSIRKLAGIYKGRGVKKNPFEDWARVRMDKNNNVRIMRISINEDKLSEIGFDFDADLQFHCETKHGEILVKIRQA